MWRNGENHYGRITIGLHWLVAITVIGLFTLGWWMGGLDYYDPWYREAPALHKGTGVLLFMVMIARVVWRHTNSRPAAVGTAFEQKAASTVHVTFYVLLFAIMLSGYLISTADGRALKVFDLFSLPATISEFENQEDLAGEIHEWLAFTVIGLTLIHALAALKHHFLDRDATLKRMLGAGN